MSKAENVLSEEVARGYLDIFFDYYDIDISEMKDKKQRDAIERTSENLIGFIRKGLLEITCEDGNLKVIQKRKNSDITISYAILCGEHKIQMDEDSSDNDHKRMYQLVGSLTSLGSKAISKLTGLDLKVAENLSVLFLAA